jgi:transposase
MTVPGIGPIIALAFVATIDDPARFAKSRNAASNRGRWIARAVSPNAATT